MKSCSIFAQRQAQDGSSPAAPRPLELQFPLDRVNEFVINFRDCILDVELFNVVPQSGSKLRLLDHVVPDVALSVQCS